MFGASYLMKLNVIITRFVFSFSMCYLAISIFLSFILLSQFHFVEKKNRSNVMTNFIFFLSTSRFRLNQFDLQELWHCDCTRSKKNSPHCYSRRFSSTQNVYTFSMIVRHNVVTVSQCMLRDSLGLK